MTDEEKLEAGGLAMGAPQAEMRPKHCPRCRREAFLWYTNVDEAKRRSPLCWGETEDECPGWPPKECT